MAAANLHDLGDAVAKGDRAGAKRNTQALLDSATPAQAIVDQGLIRGMTLVGERFMRGEAFVPELLIASRAMKESMALLEPLLAESGARGRPRHTAVLGTVQGDLHDIGKNLVAMMWRGHDIAVVDLGVNVPPERFIAAAREHHADVVGLSALLTTTLPAMTETVAALKGSGIDGLRIVIGGAPVTQSFAREAGADGFAPDAVSAVAMLLNLVGK